MLFFESKQQEEATLEEIHAQRADSEQPREPLSQFQLHPQPAPVDGAYVSSEEHLWDELSRIDQLIRAQTIRWRLTIGASKSPQLWGMIHVTDAEVDSYLETEFVPPNMLPAELEHALKHHWRAATQSSRSISKRIEQTPVEVTLRLERLKFLFKLSDLERDIILACLLPELDARYRRLYGYLQDDVSRTSPTVELLLQILYPLISDLEVGRSCFETESALLRGHLLAVSDGEPVSLRSVAVDPCVTNYLLGGDQLDARVAAVVSDQSVPLQWEQLIQEPKRIESLRNFASWWNLRRDQFDAGATLFFHGPDGGGRRAAAQAICTATGTGLLVADAAMVLRSSSHYEQQVDLIYREAALRGRALYWSGCESLLDAQQPSHIWDYLVSSTQIFRGLVFLASTVHWEPTSQFRHRLYQRMEFPLPGYKLRRRLWEAHLPREAEVLDPAIERGALAEQLANGFQLTEGQMLDVLDTARELAFQHNPQKALVSVADLYEACRRQSSRKLITFARRIEPRTELSFEDLIMPEPNRVQLMELRGRIRHRSKVYTGFGFERRLTLGQGLIALFTGSSGTGKTMAAELLAREQGVDLYKVDLSAVVSKYVGETEKNLSRVFAEAEDANAIIFFDEADALFGKRGEVKEAQDRWANMEVNYLLQRVEEYAGVVILASNLRQNIDEAFMRRIHLIVEFPFPEATARFRILSGLFPTGVERPDDSDLRLLSERFKLAGGSLKNIVLDAAFRALSESDSQPPTLTTRHLVAGAAREYQKLGRPITKSEFGDEFFKWVEEDIL